MSAISGVKDHFKRLTDSKPHHEVPEWGVTIYWTPLTIAQRKKMFPNGSAFIDEDANAMAVFEKSIDVDGKRMFSDLDDLHVLKHGADANIVRRIASAMVTTDNLIGDQLKNS